MWAELTGWVMRRFEVRGRSRPASRALKRQAGDLLWGLIKQARRLERG